MTMLVDPQRVLAQEVRGRALVDIGRHGICAEEGFAQTDQSIIGPYLHPQEIGKFSELNSLDAGDLQDRPPPYRVTSLRTAPMTVNPTSGTSRFLTRSRRWSRQEVLGCD